MIVTGFTRGQRAHGADGCNHSSRLIALGCAGRRLVKSCPYLLTSASALELYEGKVCSKSIQSYSEHRARCQGAREVPGRTWLGPAKQQMDFSQQTHFRDSVFRDQKLLPPLWVTAAWGYSSCRNQLSPPKNLVSGTTDACFLANHQLLLLLRVGGSAPQVS